MYYPREDKKKLNSFFARDLKRIRICQNYYPSCFVLTAASGTDEPRYPEVDLCQTDRHVIYSLGPRGKNLLTVLPKYHHYNETTLYQVSVCMCNVLSITFLSHI